MNWKHFYMVFIAMVTSGVVHAQTNLLNAKEVAQIGVLSSAKQAADDNDNPLAYGYVDDRDVLWSKVVWEYIDLNQKINLPYYYPTDTLNAPSNRRSLFDVLLKGIKQGKIENVYSDSFFTSKLTLEELNSTLSRVDTTDAGYEAMNEGLDDIDEYVTEKEIKAVDIEGFQIKGMWYFDKRQGELKYRLLCIAPMAKELYPDDYTGEISDQQLELFWIYYPEVRTMLHEAKVFNPKNSTHPISFDHLLNARRFNSIIIREENIHGNRTIADYVRGNSIFQLLEADKIKESIRDREIDMWNY